MPSNKRPGSNADRHAELDSAEQAGQEIYLVFDVKPPSKSDKEWEKKGKSKQETHYFGRHFTKTKG